MKLSKMAMESFRVFFFVLLLAASPLLQEKATKSVLVKHFSFLAKMLVNYFDALFCNILEVVFPECQSEVDVDVAEAVEGGELGIVGEDVQDFGHGNFGPAPGVETVCIFPKNSSKLVVAGEETELLVGMENVGGSPLNIIAIQASVHLPFDHRMLVQNLTVQTFNKASVSPSVQATFPYMFAVSRFESGTTGKACPNGKKCSKDSSKGHCICCDL
ncbi:translocon-associated protein subunit alpha-like [Gossypium australe]|uniref:Translocon-associated protein subunit alpha n=1 Tax=Gossypium australe TaxID=47621 RepID=A0A5B6V0L5_9ROSI|nr:translocon-associated protein subunit alpha-like [Gossypium australe]